MTDVPPDTPVTIPVAEPIVAAVPPLLHIPPVRESFSAVVKPMHTMAVPEGTEGLGFTVTIVAA